MYLRIEGQEQRLNKFSELNAYQKSTIIDDIIRYLLFIIFVLSELVFRRTDKEGICSINENASDRQMSYIFSYSGESYESYEKLLLDESEGLYNKIIDDITSKTITWDKR
jgi:hypothetical protein